MLEGVRWFSVPHLVAGAGGVQVTEEEALGKAVSPAYAIIATAVVTVGALWLAGERLRSFRLSGEEW